METKSEKNISGMISIVIPSILLLLIINFLTGMVQIEKLQGLPIFFPFVIGPIGAMFGLYSYRKSKSKLALFGIVFNIVMFLFPIFYGVLGTLIFGV